MIDLQLREEYQQRAKARAVFASARPALSKGASKGKGKDSAAPARQFVTPRPVKEPKAEGFEGDDSEESPAKPMSSRPSKSARPDDLIGFTPGAVCSIFSEFGFPKVGGDQAAGECFCGVEGG